jgi:hypothetical protein
MRFTLSKLICVAATGAMALGAQAQVTPSTSATGTPLNPDNASARAEASYQTAIKACSGMTGTERASCLRDARDVRNRTLGSGRAGGDSGSAAGANGSAAGSASGGAAGNGNAGASGTSGGQGAGTGSTGSSGTSGEGGASSGSSSGSSGSSGK